MTDTVYKGHVLRVERDRDPDGFYKLDHVCVCPDGRKIVMDISPYHRCTDEDFATYVDMGYPSRRFFQSAGPVYPVDLRAVSDVADRFCVDRSEPDHMRLAYLLAS